MRIDETLLNEAKAYAARNGRSLTSVMEDALRQLLNRSEDAAARPPAELPLSGDPDGPKLTWEHIQQVLEAEDLEYLMRLGLRDADA